MASISLGGRESVLGMSRKEERVLTLGVVARLEVAGACAGLGGGGGGGANAGVGPAEGEGRGGISRVGNGIAAFFLRSWILSL